MGSPDQFPPSDARSARGNGIAGRVRGRKEESEPAKRRERESQASAQNAIQPAKRSARKSEGRSPASAATPPTRPERAARERHAPAGDSRAVPDEVRERFVQVGRTFYFPDGARAFEDRGRKLMTPSANTEVIRSLVQIAQARGWNEITVSGTEAFRKESWRQARLVGLAVRGYVPSDIEQAQLVRALARDKKPARAASPQRTLALDGVAGAAAPPREDAAEGNGPEGRERPRRLIVGKLIDHGREPYRFERGAEPSYFVRLATPRGERTLWGKDLERALTHSLTQVQIGEEVGVRPVGRDAVTVRRRERDPDGRVVHEGPLETHRNRWVIENRTFFEDRAAAARTVRDASITARRATREHPELAGTYAQLHAAELTARGIRDRADRDLFVARVRSSLADAIERGEPLSPVRLHERSAERPAARVHDQLERAPSLAR